MHQLVNKRLWYYQDVGYSCGNRKNCRSFCDVNPLISFIRHLCMWYCSHVHSVPSAENWHILFTLQPYGGWVIQYANRHCERSHHSQFPKRTCKFRYADADPTWIAATCRVVTITKQADSFLKKKKWCSPEHKKIDFTIKCPLFAILLSRRTWFDPRLVLVGFIAVKVALGQILSPSTNTLACRPMLHIHIPRI